MCKIVTTTKLKYHFFFYKKDSKNEDIGALIDLKLRCKCQSQLLKTEM